MDIHYFLKRRLDFIRQFYLSASAPFVDVKKNIEAGNAPYVGAGMISDEPPYFEEWEESVHSVQVVSYACIAMLSSSLQLYLHGWLERISGSEKTANTKDGNRAGGWFLKYENAFSKALQIDFSSSPARLEIIREIVLARNRIAHPEEISDTLSRYVRSDMEKLNSPFFISQPEVDLISGMDQPEASWLTLPRVHVSEEKLLVAIVEVEKFCEWLEAEASKRIGSVDAQQFVAGRRP